MVELGRTDADQKDRISSLEKELTASQDAQKAADAKLKATLKSMKSVVVDATLHARAKLMEDFKAIKHSEGDPDYEIGFWKEREAELMEAVKGGKVAGEPLTPRVESPTMTENV